MGAEKGSETADDENARVLRVVAEEFVYHDGGGRRRLLVVYML